MGNNARLFEDMIAAQARLKVSSEAITSAQNTFTTEFNTFLSFSTVLEMQFKELEQRELEVEKREKAVAEREKDCAVVEQREQEVAEKERHWILTEKRMKDNAAKLPTVIQFNVCGPRFAISKEKLLTYKGSLFEQMIVTDHPQQLPSNEIFIERDPTYFPHVVRFIVAGVHPLSSSLSTKEQDAIFQEFDYFRIPFLFFSRDTVSNTLVDEINYGNTITKWLPNHKFQLIYKASIDGFKAQAFHKLCDNKGPTLTVIRSSGGYLFGGYSSASWDSTICYKTSTDAFIFTLHNPHNIPPTKYTVRNANYAIYCCADRGPCFGGLTHDIQVSDNANQKDVNYTYFPYGYNDTTGKGDKTFTGAIKYTASEIEVFVVL